MLTQEISVEEVTNQLDRVHRGKSTTNGARPIIEKFHKWKDSEAVKRNAIRKNKDITKAKVQVAQKYLKSLKSFYIYNDIIFNFTIRSLKRVLNCLWLMTQYRFS